MKRESFIIMCEAGNNGIMYKSDRRKDLAIAELNKELANFALSVYPPLKTKTIRTYFESDGDFSIEDIDTIENDFIKIINILKKYNLNKIKVEVIGYETLYGIS